MKKSTQISQKSCLDLTKYKFIPPSKLLQAKTQLHIPNHQHFQSVIDHDHHQQQYQHKTKEKNKKDTDKQSNKENNKKNKQNNKIFRSISNSKLQTSNSRNAILSHKHPPIDNKKSQKQLSLQKFIHIISQLESINHSKNSQLHQLKQQKKLFNEKIDKLNLTIVLKNKQIIDLNNKVKIIQLQCREKCQQYILIIDSLKKVIESQVNKINQLTNKKNNKYQPDKQKQLIYCQIPTVQFYQQQQSLEHDIIYDKSSKNSSNNHIESLLYEQQPKRPKETIHNIEKDNSRQQTYFSNLQTATHIQSSNAAKPHHDPPTPNKYFQHPPSPTKTIHPSQPDLLSSLDCSLDQAHNNLSLSRISQSVQQDFQTSRQNIKTQKVQKYLAKPNYINSSTHQQLLEEIDQYLSKRTNTGQIK